MSKVKVNVAVLDFDVDGSKVIVRDSKEAVVGFMDLGIEEKNLRDKDEEVIKQTILDNVELNNVESGKRIEISSQVEEKDEEELEEEKEEIKDDILSHEDDMLL